MAMGDNESGTVNGIFSGAVSGGMATGGNPIGIIGGAVIGGLLANSTSDKARRANIDTQKKAEAARVASLVKQMGAQQQAESIAFANLTNKNGAGKAVGSPDKPGGLIGQNISTAGTF